MSARHGGARKGAGRKRTRDKFDLPVRRAEKRIADKLPDLIDTLLRLADGVLIQAENADGTPNIYTRPPDRQAAEYLINRIMGTPTEMIEQDVDLKVGPLVITSIKAVQPALSPAGDDGS